MTETGSSLRENGLCALATLLTGSPGLVANRESYEDAGKQQAMEDIASLLRGAGNGHERVLPKLNAADVLALMTEMSGLGCVITDSHMGPLGIHAIEAVAL